MKKVQLITDGACTPNPGAGGWACILRYKGITREMWGCERKTTNNRMEITAAVRGLAALKEPCEVEIVTDSEYLKNGITSWIKGWKRNGWKTAAKQPVKNADLWQRLDEQTQRHAVEWRWVRGHTGHRENEIADSLANRGIEELG